MNVLADLLKRALQRKLSHLHLRLGGQMPHFSAQRI